MLIESDFRKYDFVPEGFNGKVFCYRICPNGLKITLTVGEVVDGFQSVILVNERTVIAYEFMNSPEQLRLFLNKHKIYAKKH